MTRSVGRFILKFDSRPIAFERKISDASFMNFEAKVITPEAKAFLETLHRQFNATRLQLLEQRLKKQTLVDQGVFPSFSSETRSIREDASWRVASCPNDLQDRRVEITGPVERKMMINALNSGAQVFMADFEDATSPTWSNVIDGQINCMDAVRKTLSLTTPEGKNYALNSKTATLVIRPRGWHLNEKHFKVDGQYISASLFDFGLYFFHNAKELLARGSGPYFYLPKLESHLEARLWNDVLKSAQDYVGIPQGSVRATVLIETIFAAFEMEEILYELREHAAGLNAGRWDYLFSVIKKFRNHKDFVLPDRAQLTMSVPFMRAYTEALVRACHRRGAHAIGGMAAFIPSRKDPEVNARAMQKVREDKTRESQDGFDGTWVAHPDLVPIAKEIFDQALGSKPNQKDRTREDVKVDPARFIDTAIAGAHVTREGFRSNIEIALLYINSWLQGQGAAAIHNLMEDAATAEISRSQLWQWVHQSIELEDGMAISPALYEKVRSEEYTRLGGERTGRLKEAAQLLDQLVLNREFAEFLTVPAYEQII